ncbi:MAG: SH3 domain-containing protein [Lachnospiraceae bacterium]|jgi:hypothetical protein|nr:SH3 domain-containing protein [Lachnospiraceae bacterium]MDD3617185.1 SH3 domain-containing protein [Lachnospiraceae bacterium]
MKNNVYRIMCGIMAFSMIFTTGCGLGDSSTNTNSDTAKEASDEEDAADKSEDSDEEDAEEEAVQAVPVNFVSENQCVSITLPSENWVKDVDTDAMRSWTCEGVGTISILHMTGADANEIQAITSQEDVSNYLESSGYDMGTVEILEFIPGTVGDYTTCTYAISFPQKIDEEYLQQEHSDAVAAGGEDANGETADSDAADANGEAAESNAADANGKTTGSNAADANGKTAGSNAADVNEEAAGRDAVDANGESTGIDADRAITQNETTPDAEKNTENQESDSKKNADSEEDTDLEAFTYDRVYLLKSEAEVYEVAAVLNNPDVETMKAVVDSMDSFKVLQDSPETVAAKQAIEAEKQRQAEEAAAAAAAAQAAAEAEAAAQAAAAQAAWEAANASQEIVAVTPFAATCARSVNIRTAPSNDSTVLGDLLAGTVVTVTGVSKNWYQFDYNGTTAYVSKRFF